MLSDQMTGSCMDEGSIRITYFSKRTNTTLWKNSITSESLALKILLKGPYQSLFDFSSLAEIASSSTNVVNIRAYSLL